jgi:hypothetical protein
MNGESLRSRLAGLALIVEGCEYDRLQGFEVKDPEALAALYDHVLVAFPDAYLEDPHHLRRRDPRSEALPQDGAGHGVERADWETIARAVLGHTAVKI